MGKFSYYFLGYRKVNLSTEDLHLAASIVVRNHISSIVSGDGIFLIRESDFDNFKKKTEGRIHFEASDCLGLYGKFKKIKYKKTLVISLLISAIITAFLSSVVWDIRVEGNNIVPSSKIVSKLSESGLNLGSFWYKKDLSGLENKLLNDLDELSWVNINRRGTVAYVKVMESDDIDDKHNIEKSGYANIIAREDCVIEEITVVNGVAMVKPGDVVKKGDILISGITGKDENEGFCRAEGRIIGRLNDSITVEVERNYTNATQNGRKLYSIDIKLFNFFINIFKLYGNSINECDIIDYEKSYSLFNGFRLPLTIYIKYIPITETDLNLYTDEEITLVASTRLNSLLASKLSGCDLLRIKSEGGFFDKGYYMRSDFVFTTEIGMISEFKVD